MPRRPRLRDRLAAETELAAALAEGGADPTRRLERRTSPELRRLALELHALRERARGRLPDVDRLLLTPKGVEQASGRGLALWRARTVDARRPEPEPLVDLTAGLGLDAAALAAGRRVVAQDLDPGTAAVCGENLRRLAGDRAVAACADARAPAARAPLVAIDPDRRPHGRRELDPARWSPTWSAVAERLRAAAGGVVKLPPASDPARLAAALPPGLPRSWSWVGRGRELVELTLWTGALADPGSPVEALRVDPEGAVAGRLAGAPADPATALDPERAGAVEWIAEPHAAALRSGLVPALAAALGAAPLGPRLGFLGPLEPGTPSPAPGPLLAVRRVLASAPADPKRVRRMLAEHDVGPVRVRVRGHPDPADRLERRFRGKGTDRGELLVARLGRGHRAYLVDEGPTGRTG